MTVHAKAGPHPGQVIIAVEGEIDLYSSTSLQRLLLDCLDKGASHLLLDLSKNEYLDSSGVGCIIRTLQRCNAVKARLAVVGVTGTPLKVLQLSNIISLLPSFASIEEATATFRH